MTNLSANSLFKLDHLYKLLSQKFLPLTLYISCCSIDRSHCIALGSYVGGSNFQSKANLNCNMMKKLPSAPYLTSKTLKGCEKF